MTLHVGSPNTLEEHDEYWRHNLKVNLDAILDSGRLTNNGPYVKDFEEQIKAQIGVKHAVAVCNGTVGLEIAAKALGLSGEVIVPAWTFIATAHAMSWIGLRPVFCDVNLRQLIDPERIESLITPKTSAILGTHLWGRPCDTEAIQEIADKHDLKVFYDAAHAFDCTHGPKFIGHFGECEVFSFHATKFVHSFEGGVITTNSEYVADQCRQMRNFGFTGYDRVDSLGTNGKMSEIHAAMGLSMVGRAWQLIHHNRNNYKAYRRELDTIEGIDIMVYTEGEYRNYQYIVALVEHNRDELLAILHKNGIMARRYFYPGCHRMAPYRFAYTPMPMTEWLADRVLVLPTGTSVNDEDIEIVCELIREVLT